MKKYFTKLIAVLFLLVLFLPIANADFDNDWWNKPYGGDYIVPNDDMDLGSAADPLDDIYAGTLYISGVTLTGDLNMGTNDIITTGSIGRDTDNEINWGTDDSLAIVIGGTTDNITGIDRGVGDNDTMVTQGYVDDAVAGVVETDPIVGAVTGLVQADGASNISAVGAGGIAANLLQSSAADLGAANVTIDLGNTNGAYVTNLTTDGTITATVGFAGDVTGDLTGNADTVTNGVYTTDNMSVMSATTSAQLAGVISDETGTDKLVYNTSPSLVTPALGAATATSIGMNGQGKIEFQSANNYIYGYSISQLHAVSTGEVWLAAGGANYVKAIHDTGVTLKLGDNAGAHKLLINDSDDALVASIDSNGIFGAGTWEATDVGVEHGGTGLSTCNAYAPIVGGTTDTGAFQCLASEGTAAQVLTSNGAGALPTYQDAGGGGGATAFNATIGSAGADYTDIQAAITGLGGTDFRFQLITDVTEDSDVTMADDSILVLDVANFEYSIDDYKFIGSGDGSFTIKGNGQYSGAKFITAATGYKDKIDWATPATSYVAMHDVYWDNNDTGSYGILTDAGYQNVHHIAVDHQNADQNLFRIHNGPLAIYDNITAIGYGGDTAGMFRDIGKGMIVSNIFIEGDWANGADFIESSGTDTVSNIILDEVAGGAFDISGGGNSTYTNMTGQIDFVMDGDNISISNSYFTGNAGGAGSLDMGSRDDNVLNGVTGIGTLDMTDVSANDNIIMGCEVANAITFAGDRNKVGTSRFRGGASISSGSDDNGFTNTQFGADAGGGAYTLTIDSGANRTRAVGNMTDVIISDAGTDSELGFNPIY